MDEHTLSVLLSYTVTALKDCSAWTHSDVLLALSTVVYGNGPHCQQVDVVLITRVFCRALACLQ